MNKVVQKGKGHVGQLLTGTVVSTKNVKTVIVQVEHMHRHPIYQKTVKRTKHFAVHNELEGVALGDTVLIAEVKPISKTKHFIVKEKITL